MSRIWSMFVGKGPKATDETKATDEKRTVPGTLGKVIAYVDAAIESNGNTLSLSPKMEKLHREGSDELMEASLKQMVLMLMAQVKPALAKIAEDVHGSYGTSKISETFRVVTERVYHDWLHDHVELQEAATTHHYEDAFFREAQFHMASAMDKNGKSGGKGGSTPSSVHPRY